MPLYAPKKVVLNWYKYDISFSLELIKSFIDGIENQADDSISRYENEKQTLVLEEVPEENYAHVVEMHQGLDDETWDLDRIFKEYFPSLQRRSALLTLSGYFEHELDKLCSLYKSENSYDLSLSDLSGKGIDRAANYLEKVGGLNVHKASSEWDHIKGIQRIRNLIVHQDGNLKDQQGNPVKDAVDYVKKIESLSGEEEVVIKNGFLTHVIEKYDSYFSLLNQSILARRNA